MTYLGPEDATMPQGAAIDDRAVPWTWRDLAAGIGGVLVLLFLVAATSYPFLDRFGRETEAGRLTEAAFGGAWYVCSVLFVYLVIRRRGASWHELGFRKPQLRGASWPRLVRAVVLFLLAAYVAVLVYNALIEVLGLDFLRPDKQLEDEVYDSDSVVIATGILVVFGAPFVEEMLFRGFLFAKLRMHIPFVYASAFSGGLFSLAHGDPGLILPFTVVGMLLAFVYERTGTLWGSIGVHFCFNLITYLILVFVPEAR